MAYYNNPNNNFGIPTLDLTQFGLEQPQNNMQLAELFNYNTLPQATKSFTPRSTMTTGTVVDNFIKDNPNATRGDFMKALQDGTLGVGSRQLFDKNVDDLFVIPVLLRPSPVYPASVILLGSIAIAVIG